MVSVTGVGGGKGTEGQNFPKKRTLLPATDRFKDIGFPMVPCMGLRC